MGRLTQMGREQINLNPGAKAEIDNLTSDVGSVLVVAKCYDHLCVWSAV